MLAVGAIGARGAERELRLDFSNTPLGVTPTNFTSAVSGKGAPGQWVTADVEAPSNFPSVTGKATATSSQRVLAQVSRDPTDEHFPLLVYDAETFGDFSFKARVRMVGGGLEQMAGLAFRIQDEKNYYVVRANALNGNFRFYKFVNGQRSTPVGPSLPVAFNEWHEIEVRCRGNEMQFFLNGELAMPAVTDTSFRRGRIGFWTKSDSESQFAGAVVRYTPQEILAVTLVSGAMKAYDRLRGLKLISRPDGDAALKVVAASPAEAVGETAGEAEQECFKTGRFYQGKAGRDTLVTVPLRDKNGDVAAVLEVRMETFPGQTNANKLERALAVGRWIQSRFLTRQELFE